MSARSTAAPCRLALRLRASERAVCVARAALDVHLRRAGWPLETRRDVVLAVDEAVDNAVEHGSEPMAQVEVEVILGDDIVQVRVRDQGGGGRVPQGKPSPPAEDSTRGRGRLIMAALSDEVRWTRSGAGTEVTLGFRRRHAAPLAHAEASCR